jgi:hypothetical protein
MSRITNKERFVHYLPVYGSFSTALIYLSIGVIAILSFLRLKDGGADESSLLVFLEDYFFGKILIGIILFGMLSFVIWRIFEAIKDPYLYGSNLKGLGRRTGIALSSFADAFIAYAAIRILFNTGKYREDGQPYAQRETVSNILTESWGDWVIILLGAIILITAIVQFYYGVTRGYRERLDIARFNGEKKKLIHFFAWMGYPARGIIIGIIGFFLIKAGYLEEARHVVNTDKAFNFIGDHIGKLPFIIVAVGTICYGIFMIAMGITYDADNDPSKTKK